MWQAHSASLYPFHEPCAESQASHAHVWVPPTCLYAVVVGGQSLGSQCQVLLLTASLLVQGNDHILSAEAHRHAAKAADGGHLQSSSRC